MTAPQTLFTSPAASSLSRVLSGALGQQARRGIVRTTYNLGLSSQRHFSTSRWSQIEFFPPARDTSRIKETRAAWPHDTVTEKQLNSVEPFVHRDARSISDRLAFGMVKTLRFFTDLFTGYRHDESKPYIMNERKWLTRFIFLETVAAVPGMTAAMLRHFRSLRRLQRDNGWIETMLEEAYNERMHLLTFMKMAEPGWFMKMMILGAQGVFANGMFLAYLISPATCHRFVGYLEEEATNTYTYAIADIDKGRLPSWTNMRAPDIAIKYWSMPEGNQNMRDLLLYIRADEAKHREVNHTLGNLDQKKDPNPYVSEYQDASKPHPTTSLKTLKSHGWEREEVI